MQAERRTYTRFDISFTVEFKQVKGKSRVFSGTALNFSRAGVCLKIKDGAPELREAVELNMKLPHNNSVVPALGDVLWIDKNDNQCVLGIKLVVMDKEAKFDLLDYCRNVQVYKHRYGLSMN